MGLIRRVRDRFFAKKPAPGIGAQFHAAYEEDWKDLEEQVDNYTQKTGAAIVQSWEVGAAEFAGAVRGRDGEKQLIERYSDALVPTLSPFQDLHKKVGGSMKQGWADGRRSGNLAEANRHLLGLVVGLGERAEGGWAKTVEYLDPLFGQSVDPSAAQATMLAHGAGLRRACDDAERVLAAELDKGPTRPTLWAAVTDPFDLWQLALVRGAEITLTTATRELARGVRASQR